MAIKKGAFQLPERSYPSLAENQISISSIIMFSRMSSGYENPAKIQ